MAYILMVLAQADKKNCDCLKDLAVRDVQTFLALFLPKRNYLYFGTLYETSTEDEWKL